MTPHRRRRPLLALVPPLALVPILAASGCSRAPRAVTAPPAAERGAVERGLASWYGAEFANLPTANGETFDPAKVSAAHRTLPLGTVVDVTNERNGRTVRVRINDRGPFVAGRIVDLSKAAAQEIGAVADGVVPVALVVVEVGDGARRRRPAEPTGTARAAAWAVQAGAFGDEANALRLKDRLAERYPSPFIEEFAGLKRVKFGPYVRREDADEAQESLRDLGLAGVVVPYP